MVMLKAPTKMGSSFLSILEHLKAHKYLCSYIKMQCLPTLQWLINFFFLAIYGVYSDVDSATQS